ncbi:uncharacterized protein [Nicotiana sylvestris]|uniref:uncharacterized protein n=1 Tax=Nicotiana sylvestris TaxID=4096 RepID=UPI00388CC803
MLSILVSPLHFNPVTSARDHGPILGKRGCREQIGYERDEFTVHSSNSSKWGKIAKLEIEDVELETEKWSSAIVLYVIGETPTIGAVDRFLTSVGKFSVKLQIFYHNEGYFVIRFTNLEERDQVLYSGPHTINNKPMIMKVWSDDFNVHDEVLKTIPLWVRFPNLPINCWGMKALSKIGSTLGNPIYADECTTGSVRISYARMLIEMDITKPLPRYVKLQDHKGRLIQQEVTYDWEPKYCTKCLKIGHDCAEIKTVQLQRVVQQRKIIKNKQEAVVINQQSEPDPINNDAQRKEEGWITVLGKLAARAAKAKQAEDQEILGSNGFQSLAINQAYDEPGTSTMQERSSEVQGLYHHPYFILV